MAVGLPVVATEIDGPVEILKEGITGRLVPDDDPDRLAEALGELISDRRYGPAPGRDGARTGADRIRTRRAGATVGGRAGTECYRKVRQAKVCAVSPPDARRL